MACSNRSILNSGISNDIIPATDVYYSVKDRTIIRHAMVFDAECTFLDDQLMRRIRVPDSEGNTVKIPDTPYACFAFIITNKTLTPVKVESISGDWYSADTWDNGGISAGPVLRSSGNDNAARTLYSYHRIVVDEFSFDRVPSQTVRYPFEYIAPEDRILFFKFFPYPSVRNGRIKLTLSVLNENQKKTVDFEFIQKESLIRR